MNHFSAYANAWDSMIACCPHHVVDVLPVLGLSAVAVLLAEYQTFLLSVGIVSNVVGLAFIFYTIKKHNLYLSDGLMARISAFNMKVVFYNQCENFCQNILVNKKKSPFIRLN